MRASSFSHVPFKATRVLHVVLIAMALILLRVWHLAVIQHEARVEAAEAPTRRVVIEPARRASIRDRFGLPLAINRVQYNAAIGYAQIGAIPAVKYEADADGKKVRRYKRREHIRQLSELLATELNLNADELEDRIHAEAAFYDHVPYVVKKDISEKEYYRLKMLEMSWPGLIAQRVPKRHYPQGKVAGDVVGFMGAIDAQTYQNILQERKVLQAYVRSRDAGEDPPLPNRMESPQEVRERLRDIEEMAYSINDHIGKGGVEAYFEESLRGYHGKKRFYVDSKGHYLRELPGQRPPIPGRGLTLTLSSELQQFSEQLLAQNDKLRQTRVFKPHREAEDDLPAKDPWIKGGAIVALDPNNGEVIALASYPRFDPNDFVPSGDPAVDSGKSANIRRWFETESYIAEMWDGKRPLARETFDVEKGFVEEEQDLSWERYLDLILYDQGDARKGLQRVRNVENAVAIQKAAESLIALSGGGDLCYLLNLLYQEEGHVTQKCPLPAAERERIEANLNMNADDIEKAKTQLDPFLGRIKHAYDKVLIVDFCRLAVNGELFNEELLNVVGNQSLTAYRRLNQATVNLEEVTYAMAKELFHTTLFVDWRAENEKSFLKEKRHLERLAGKYARPYTEYLDAKEKELFRDFWQDHSSDILIAFLQGRQAAGLPDIFATHFRSWHQELASGAHAAVPWRSDYIYLQKALRGIDPSVAQAYLASMRSFKQLTRPLFGRYRQLRTEKGQQLERHLAAAFYPTYGYGYGRSLAYRQATPQGSIYKLVTAYGALVQSYQSDPTQLNPLKIIDQPMKLNGNWIVGYTMDGKPIPQAYKGGNLPRTLTKNIGEIDIVRAIEVSSNAYFSLLASDYLSKPTDLADAGRALSYGAKTGIALPGEISGRIPTDLEYNRAGLYSMAIGQHSLVVTPLQTAVMFATIANGGKVFEPKIVRTMGGRVPSSSLVNDYSESLSLAGIDFPLFVNTLPARRLPPPELVPSVIKRQVFMPAQVRSMLLDGMFRVAHRYQNRAVKALQLMPGDNSQAIHAVNSMGGQMAGKTSTAEIVESLGPDRQIGSRTYNHVWFGSIVYDKDGGQETVFYDSKGKPELVVIVFLRYGAVGSDAVPLAAQVAAKWREVKQRALH